MKAAIALLALLVAGAAHAERHSQVGLAVGADRLSNGTPDWSETAVRYGHTFAPRRTLELSVLHTERFGLRDRQLAVQTTQPLSAALTATLDANVSSTHRVLAESGAGATLQYEFAPAWLLHAGARTTAYSAERVNQGVFLLEHYVSSYSWAAGWRPARAFDTTAHGFEARASYYYGDRDSVGLILAGGKEAANIGGTVVLDTVRSATLVGRHWLTPDWALQYSLGHTRQGDYYHRNGISLGLQYAF